MKGVARGLFVALVMVAASGATAQTVTIRVEDVIVVPEPADPVMGFFEVYFEVTAPPAQQLTSYDLILDLEPVGSGVTLLGASLTVDHAPVLPTGSLTLYDNYPDKEIEANCMLFVGSEEINNLEGLLRVQFQVDAGQPESFFDVTIDTELTKLADDTFPDPEPILYEVQNGQIHVIPEPATGVVLLGGGLLVALGRRRRA